MEARVLFRTHYQVDEPAYITVLVKGCTSPVRSAYDELVARNLSREVRARNKEFNVAAAGYAVSLARCLGVINDQNVWTEKGQLVNLVAEVQSGPWAEGLELDFQEKLLMFRLFLEADGAALLYLANHLLRGSPIPNGPDGWNLLARDMFLEVFTDYLRESATTAERVKLRAEIDRIRAKGYSGKSGAHKLFLHLQTLLRFGLVHRKETGIGRVYELAGADPDNLEKLLVEIPDVHRLEEVVRHRGWPRVAAAVFGRGSRVDRLSEDELLRLLVPRYKAVAATGVPLCMISPLLDAVEIKLLASQSTWVPYEALVEVLKEVQKRRGKDVRFHVDRRGAPAFVKLSEALIAEYAGA